MDDENSIVGLYRQKLLRKQQKQDAIEVLTKAFGRHHDDDSQIRLAASRWSSMPTASAIGRELVKERKRFSEAHEQRRTIDKSEIVVGGSPALFAVFEAIHRANAEEDEPTIVILGETGVGKTMLAALIHKSSRRAGRPYKEVNAAGSGGDANIQRGEWIGYGPQHGIIGIDKRGKSGHLGEVERGSLFVDEFTLLSKDLQGIFLSILEKRSVQQVGGGSITPDVRCIFASNADLGKEVAKGELRGDLLARIRIPIPIPSLYERRGDILALARHFAGTDSSFTYRARLALLHYAWPENIRELQGVLKGAISRRKAKGGSVVDIGDLNLPESLVQRTVSVPDEMCQRNLWALADEIAGDEGFEHGTGRQRRAGEIVGVGQAQASKVYSDLGLSGPNTWGK